MSHTLNEISTDIVQCNCNINYRLQVKTTLKLLMWHYRFHTHDHYYLPCNLMQCSHQDSSERVKAKYCHSLSSDKYYTLLNVCRQDDATSVVKHQHLNFILIICSDGNLKMIYSRKCSYMCVDKHTKASMYCHACLNTLNTKT
jgi:hypothetical protein